MTARVTLAGLLLIAAAAAGAEPPADANTPASNIDATIRQAEADAAEARTQLASATGKLNAATERLKGREAQLKALRQRHQKYHKTVTSAESRRKAAFAEYMKLWRLSAWTPVDTVSRNLGGLIRTVAAAWHARAVELRAEADPNGKEQRDRTFYVFLVQIDSENLLRAGNDLRKKHLAYLEARKAADLAVQADGELAASWRYCEGLDDLKRLLEAEAPQWIGKLKADVHSLEHDTIPKLQSQEKHRNQVLAELRSMKQELLAPAGRPTPGPQTQPQPPSQPQPQPPPAPKRKQPKIVWKVLRADASGLTGSAGNRYRVWRIIIRFEEVNGVPVLFRLAKRAPVPKTQLPASDIRESWFPPSPVKRYTMRVDEPIQLRGIEGPAVLDLDTAMGEGTYRRAPEALHATDYLTVWEKDDFRGQYRATFEGYRGYRDVIAPFEVSWAAKGKAPEKADPRIQVIRPYLKTLAEGCEPRVYFDVQLKETLPAGIHWMRVRFDEPAAAPPYYLYVKLDAAGEPRFKGYLTVPAGRFGITFSVPEVEGLGVGKLEGVCRRQPWSDYDKQRLQNAQKQIRSIAASLAGPGLSQSLRDTRLATQAGYYAALAELYNRYGEHDEAKRQADAALRALKQTSLSISHSGYRDTQKLALVQMGQAAFYTGDAKLRREAGQALADLWTSAAELFRSGRISGSYATNILNAGAVYVRLAEQLAQLGVPRTEARKYYLLGLDCYRKAGRTDSDAHMVRLRTESIFEP